MISVFTLRGTGETTGSANNMLTGVTSKLSPSKYVLGGDIDYPASIGPANPQNSPFGASEEQSIQRGVELIAEAVRATPNLVGLLGYSLGAETVSRFMELKGQGQYADCEIAWAGFVANPNRAPGESIDGNSIGYGIAGAHKPYPAHIATFNAANPQDGITSCPADSPLRQLSDGISNLTFVGNTWTSDLLNRMLTNRWQPSDPWWWLHPIETFNRYNNAAALLRGYLFDGQHTTAYIHGGYLTRLAQRLNEF